MFPEIKFKDPKQMCILILILFYFYIKLFSHNFPLIRFINHFVQQPYR